MTETRGKVCTKCGLFKEYEYFHKKKSMKDGYRSACKECTNKQNAEYASDNPEKVKESRARYREANREKLRKKSESYRLQNREECIARSIRWRDRNYSRYIETSRRYYLENKDEIKERQREYDSRNKSKKAIREQRRRAKMRGLPNSFSSSEWQECLEAFDNSCCYCGEQCTTLQQDHFIPVNNQGGYEKGNIVPACQSCNASKGAKNFSEWYKESEQYSPVREERIYRYLASVTEEGVPSSHT